MLLPQGWENSNSRILAVHSYSQVLCELLIERAETGKQWEFTAIFNHGTCCLPRGQDQQSGIRAWGNCILREVRFTDFAFWLPCLLLLRASTTHWSMMLRGGFFLFLTRQVTHSSLDENEDRSGKSNASEKRRNKTWMQWFTTGSLCSRHHIHLSLPTLPATSVCPAQSHKWVPLRDPGALTGKDSHSFQVTHSAAENPIKYNYINAKREPSVVYKTLKSKYAIWCRVSEMRAQGHRQNPNIVYRFKKGKKTNQSACSP